MNKTRNHFRKCGFCPHHNEQKKCCCQKPHKLSKNSKKSKIKPMALTNESSIRIGDNGQVKFEQINISDLLGQNSMLKCQNRNLKDNLLSISHCINQQRIHCKQYISIPTSHTLKTQSEQLLSDRLYISNKNLQEAILRVDALSRQNKQLNERNSIINSRLQSLNLQNEELAQDVTELSKKLRKMQEKYNQVDRNCIKEDYRLLRQKYQNLKSINYNLIQEGQRLKQLSKRHENMSPEWIAETSNKLTFIEQKIDCAENRFKDSYLQKEEAQIPLSLDQFRPGQNQNNSAYFELIHQVKQQLALSINAVHSKTRKYKSVFDTVGNVENTNMTSLICTLIQGFVQSCLNFNVALQRQMNRKINVLQKRMDNLLGKLENFVLQFKNRQLRKRSTSRSRIMTNNKAGLNVKSPCLRRLDKENFNSLNSIDKSY